VNRKVIAKMTAKLKKPLKLDLLSAESGSASSKSVETYLYGALVFPGGGKLGKRQFVDISIVVNGLIFC
jgi:hypothetical protein